MAGLSRQNINKIARVEDRLIHHKTSYTSETILSFIKISIMSLLNSKFRNPELRCKNGGGCDMTTKVKYFSWLKLEV